MPYDLEADARAHLDGTVVHDLPMTRRRRQTLLTAYRGDDAAIVLFDRRSRRRRWVDRAVFVATEVGWDLDSTGRFDRNPDSARPEHPRALMPLDGPGDQFRSSAHTGSGGRVSTVIVRLVGQVRYVDFGGRRLEVEPHGWIAVATTEPRRAQISMAFLDANGTILAEHLPFRRRPDPLRMLPVRHRLKVRWHLLRAKARGEDPGWLNIRSPS